MAENIRFQTTILVNNSKSAIKRFELCIDGVTSTPDDSRGFFVFGSDASLLAWADKYKKAGAPGAEWRLGKANAKRISAANPDGVTISSPLSKTRSGSGFYGSI